MSQSDSDYNAAVGRMQTQIEDLQSEVIRLTHRWTMARPITAGWYGFRRYPTSHIRFLEVTKPEWGHGKLAMDGWTVDLWEGEWFGPIQIPENTVYESV